MASKTLEDDGTRAFAWALLFGVAAALGAWGRVGTAGVFVLVLFCARMLGIGLMRRRRHQRAARGGEAS